MIGKVVAEKRRPSITETRPTLVFVAKILREKMKLEFHANLSPFPAMRVWQAIKRGHSFVIVLEENMGGEFEGWTGYSLSWKKLPSGKTNRIGPPFHTSHEAAVKACELLAEQVLK